MLEEDVRGVAEGRAGERRGLAGGGQEMGIYTSATVNATTEGLRRLRKGGRERVKRGGREGDKRVKKEGVRRTCDGQKVNYPATHLGQGISAVFSCFVF